MKSVTRPHTIARVIISLLLLAGVDAALFAQSEPGEGCTGCFGPTEPTPGALVGQCFHPAQLSTTESFKLFQNPVFLWCFTQTPTGPVPCESNLCCDSNSTGYWMCNKLFDAATCQPRYECGRICCIAGGRVVELPSVFCPGSIELVLRCQPI